MNESALRALEKYSEKQIKSTKKRKKRKGPSPEKIVEREVMKFLNENGFSCNVVEAKAVYNPAAGRFLRGQTDAGFPDICGITPNGIGCFIELKAKGRRSTLKDHQRDFLVNKINRGAFAACIDSVDDLKQLCKKMSICNKDERIKLLLNHLPKKKKEIGEDTLF